MLNNKYLTQRIKRFLTLLRYHLSLILNRKKSTLYEQDEYFVYQSDFTFKIRVANL